ncbi:MAG: endo-1,4-beta-xylanase [Phycisphaerales bacterium]|nr:endo-1,4-beta-xylanase [Phycisphaerales bacterium]
MLSFAVFDSEGPLREWPVRLAYTSIAGELPLQSPVRLDQGKLICDKASTDAAALTVQYPVDSPTLRKLAGEQAIPKGGDGTQGLLTLRTTLLPERDTPYLLSLELARHRIMEFLNRLEEWGMFDLPADDEVLQEFELARQTFTQAIVAQRGSKEGAAIDADRLARAALAQAIDAGDKLAMRHADRALELRLSGKAYAKASQQYTSIVGEAPTPGHAVVVPGTDYAVLPGAPMVGCAVGPDQCNEGLQKVAAGACDFIRCPMRWVDLEPGEGKYDFAPTDRWIEWAVRHAKVPVFGGPLIDLRASCVPEWLYIWENDYETLRELVYDHVQQIVTRYRRTVSRWSVCSGLHVNTNFKLSFEQIMDLTRLCVLVVKKLHPAAKIEVDIAQPWGDYHAEQKRSLPPHMYAEAIVQAGLAVDAIGLRLQMGHAAQGRTTRDLMAISSLLDRYATLQKPLVITAAGVPSAPTASSGEPARDGGFWRTPWNETTQADWIGKLLAICVSKPYVQSVCWQDLGDGSPRAEMPGGGIATQAGTPKPSALRMAQIRQALRAGKSFAALAGV